MLEYDPAKRIKPLEALGHPFFKEYLGDLVLPSVSLFTPPISEIQPMLDVTSGEQTSSEKIKPNYKLILRQPLNDPISKELFSASKQNEFKSRTFSSTKESRKHMLMREILNSLPSDTCKRKHGRDSTNPGSQEYMNGRCISKYKIIINMG
jgi:hypothetical protein